MAQRFGSIDYRKTGIFQNSNKSSKTQSFDSEYGKDFMESEADVLERRRKRDARVTASQKDKIDINPRDNAVGKFVYGDVLDSKKRRQKQT